MTSSDTGGEAGSRAAPGTQPPFAHDSPGIPGIAAMLQGGPGLSLRTFVCVRVHTHSHSHAHTHHYTLTRTHTPAHVAPLRIPAGEDRVSHLSDFHPVWLESG